MKSSTSSNVTHDNRNETVDSAEYNAAVFNNAGVECFFAGHPEVAWDLFKGALEVRLASERSNETRETTTTNRYVSRAESHVSNLDCYVNRQSSSSIGESKNTIGLAMATRSSISWAEDSGITSSTMDVLDDSEEYRPYMCLAPFRIPQDCDSSRNEHSKIEDAAAVGINEARSSSAIIIFNLALVDHLRNRSSRQAISLYELATTLVVGVPVDAAGIALINNIGVWCFENGDMPGASRCMEHLSRIINRRGAALVNNPKDRAGLVSNIMWILNPPQSASPAA